MQPVEKATRKGHIDHRSDREQRWSSGAAARSPTGPAVDGNSQGNPELVVNSRERQADVSTDSSRVRRQLETQYLNS
jgi:hypothetical protein